MKAMTAIYAGINMPTVPLNVDKRGRGRLWTRRLRVCGVMLTTGMFTAGLIAPRAVYADTPPSLDALLGLKEPASAATEDSVMPALDHPSSGDLMRRALSRMSAAADRLRPGSASDAGSGEVGPVDLATQRLQREALDALDALIAQLNRPSPKRDKSGGASSGASQQADTGSRANVSPSSADSSGATRASSAGAQAHSGHASPGAVAGGGADGSLERNDADGKAWGHLPMQVRGELSQGVSDPFSAAYQRLTEAYYQRLARRDGDRDAGADISADINTDFSADTSAGSGAGNSPEGSAEGSPVEVQTAPIDGDAPTERP